MASNFQFNNGGSTADLSSVAVLKYPFTQGGLWSWGYNSQGQLGNNSITSASSPVQTTAGGINWLQLPITGGGDAGAHSAAIKSDGTLWLWGWNIFGGLGDLTTTSKSSPVQTVAGGSNWKQVSLSNYTSGAIKSDGTLWMWGQGTSGQLGNNSSTNRSSPVQTVAGGSNWKQIGVGSSHTGALKTDGTLWLWGYNFFGNLGNNSTTSVSSPIQTVAGGTNWKQISVVNYTSAIKTDGTLWAWGINGTGQLGNNSTNHVSSPIQTVAGGTNWKQVAAGINTNAALKTDGTLWLWGYNSYGQLGNNSTTSVSSPIQTVSGGTNWTKLASRGATVSAIKTDGTLWLWGQGTSGQLGNNSSTDRSSPVQTVAGGTNWKSSFHNGDFVVAMINNY